MLTLAWALSAFTVQGQLAGNVTVSITGNTAFVRWQGITGVKCRVERSIDSGASWQGIDAPTTAFAETNILTVPAPQFRVANWLSAYPKNENTPLTPDGATAQAASCTRATLSWSALNDKERGASATSEYLIYRGGAFLKSVPHTAGASTFASTFSADDTSVLGASTYAYQVATMDRAGNISARSAAVSVTTPACPCSYSISRSGASLLGASGGSESFNVSAGSTCVWTATANQPWIHATSSGSGNGTVNYTVDANNDANSRSGMITLGDQALAVNQAGIACSYTLNTTSGSHGAGAENGSFGVTAAAECSWSAAANQTWIHTTSSGSGNGTVFCTVDANNSTNARAGTITVNGQSFSVSQAGTTEATEDLEPPSATLLNPISGAMLSGQVEIIARVTDNVSVASVEFYIDNSGQWVSVGMSVGSSATCTNSVLLDTATVENGAHTLMCRPLDGAGNYSFAMLAVTITNSACSYTLNPADASHGVDADSGSFGVTAAAGCSWSAATSQAWIHATSSGSGSGTAYYTVDANSSTSARSGTVTVNGQSFAVNQAGIACSYALNSANGSHGAGADSGSFGVTAAAGCSWSAATSQAWIHATSSGSGTGTAYYTVDTNSSTSARSGTITVNGQTFIVNQAGITCSYALNSASASHGVGADSGSFGVTAPAGCSWSAATSQTWIHATSSGSGTGTAYYTVDANSSTSERSGTITVNGQTFIVNQAGIACSYTLNSASGSHPATADSGNFGVTAQAGCAWSAVTSQTWIHATSTGSGNGTAYYIVDANSSTSARSGTIIVSGHSFTVNQAGIACSYTLNSASGSHPATADSGSFGVTAAAVCSWSAATSQTWIHATSSGSGTGTAYYTVDASSSTSARSGTITVGGQTFTVNQAGIICGYTLNSASGSHGTGAESGSFGVTAPAGCSWSAATSQTWIHATSSGSGTGTAYYAVDANSSSTSARSGTITVGGQTFTVNQAGIICSYTLNSASASHGVGADSGSFGVTAPAGCSWSAATSQTWIHATSSGNGTGTAYYTVDANSSTSERSGTITVNGQTFIVNQAGITCSYTLNSTSGSHPAGADSGSFGVTAQAGCAWSAATSQAWIHATSTGSGNGTAYYIVDANSSTSERSGTITVSGQTFTVNQAGITCSYTLNPASGSHPATAESGSFGVTAAAGCSWSAATSQTWIHATSSGNGTGTAYYTVDANSSTSARSGAITVNDQTFTVNQAGIICSYTLNSASGSHPAAAESGSFGVTAPAGCSWSAATSQTWIHATSGGSGSGTAYYTVDANSSMSARSGTITVGGQTFTVNQAGIPCSYTLNSASGSHPAAAESGSFGVTAAAGCSWSAATSQTWIHATSTGSGNGTAYYTVDGNSGTSARSGTITVGGQTFTVNQAGITCSYTLNSASASHGVGADSGSFGVTAATGCSWSAAPSQTWIHATSSGSGSGTAYYTVDANSSTSARSGTITVGGQTFTVNQAGITCSYTLNSASGSHPAAAASGSFDVTAPAGCSWSAATSQTWIHATSTGSGTGTAYYTVDANSSTSERSGTITVGGQTFTVNQGGSSGCSYVLNPTSGSQGILAGSGSFGVTAQAGCSWSATVGQDLTWIHTTSSGSGNGTVNYTVDGNVTLSARLGTIAVNGQTFSVSQAGPFTGDVVAPVATFLAPSEGAMLSGQVPLRARLTDNLNLARADFYIDNVGTWIPVGTSAHSGIVSTNVVTLDTTIVPNGPHSLLCQAFDALGTSGYAIRGISISNFTVNPGVSLWLKEIARPTSTGEAMGNAVTGDGQTNMIVVGNFKGSVNFGSVTNTALGGSDIFIGKFGTNGNLLWVRTFGGSSEDSAAAVATDASGSIYVTGYFFGTCDFGGGPLTSADGIYGSDIFVAKYSSNGTHLWSKRLGGRLGNNGGAGIAVDPAGNVIVAGKIYGEADLGAGLLLTRAGSADGFVLKLAGQTGAYLWAKDFGGIDSETVKGVAVDSLGDVVVVGFSYAGIDFGGGLVANQGSSDLFVAKYAGADGHYLWSRVAGSLGPDTAEGVAVDMNQNIFVTGSYYDSMNLGGVLVTAPIEAGIYLAKYNGAGSLQWARNIAYETTSGLIGVRGVAVDSAGNVAITGNASGGVDFGSGQASYGDANIYVAKYSPQGGYLWSKRSAALGRCAAYAIATDKDRNVFSTGFIQEDVNIDGLLVSSPGPQIKSAFLYKTTP